MLGCLGAAVKPYAESNLTRWVWLTLAFPTRTRCFRDLVYWLTPIENSNAVAHRSIADLQAAIPDPLRQVYEGMANFMDEHIQIIVDAIKAKGVWNQTLVVFSSESVATLLPRSALCSPLSALCSLLSALRFLAPLSGWTLPLFQPIFPYCNPHLLVLPHA